MRHGRPPADVLISIHAPRKGGDHSQYTVGAAGLHFNPRPPRGGRLWQSAETPDSINIFQSTPPARGATADRGVASVWIPFQSTPPARGATMCLRLPIKTQRFQSTPPARGATAVAVGLPLTVAISIHAPREGGDRHADGLGVDDDAISIHAPREGGDVGVSPISTAYGDFNPRPPRGGRL